MKPTGVDGLRRSAAQTGAPGRCVAVVLRHSPTPSLQPLAASSNHLAVEGPAVMFQPTREGNSPERADLLRTAPSPIAVLLHSIHRCHARADG
ncbi:hypothetical protein PR202_ga21316 [Eleusine coracana subsp. coracana]|uniref:Uncharacterized protein n=1 Tax=Eleusine coracana subsp. coracana TaxID=191504 RepID=A0AAV5D0L9_ELECO|nr:hypothetical protein PR202_ga21316 [Eleusine coracana subsp. coracana]